MKRNLTWLALPGVAIATAISIAACSRNAQPKTEQVSQSQADTLVKEAHELKLKGNFLAADQKIKEASTHYARLGELLLMPEGIQYADEMFQHALELDPTNGKANFYKASTEPLLTMRGFLPRIERLFVSEEDQKGFERLREDIEKLKMPEFSSFANDLPAGDSAFVTYYDVQRFAREKLLPAFQGSIEKLKRIDTSQPLQLNFTPERLQFDPVRHSSNSSYSYSQCTNNPTTGWTCTYSSDHWNYEETKKRNVYFVDQYDLKILITGTMAIVDQLRLGTAYGLHNVEYAIRRIKAIDSLRKEQGLDGINAKDLIQVLQEYPSLFTLEKDQQIAEIQKSAAQSLKNAIELADLRNQLCDRKSRNELTSIIYPICIGADAADSLRVSLDLIAGPKEITLGKDEAGNPVRIVMDLTKVFKAPPTDLKSLLPTSFGEDGAPVNYPDPTMNGLFPNGDIIEKLKQLGSDDSRHYEQTMHDVRHTIRKISDHI